MANRTWWTPEGLITETEDTKQYWTPGGLIQNDNAVAAPYPAYKAPPHILVKSRHG